MAQSTTTYTFDKLIAPFSREQFFSEYWEKKPLLLRREDSAYYTELLSLKILDRVLTTQTLQGDTAFIANAQKQVSREEFTFPDGVVDVARLFQQFAEGGTIVFNQLHTYVPMLADLCRSLERELSTRFQTNIYLTPTKAQGFPSHYDSHDVFILQVHGTKHWILYDAPIELPFRGQPFQRNETKIGAVSAEFDMRPGDMLYMPRGILHDAQTRETETMHITVGVLQTTWTELLLEAVAKVATSEVDFRRSLPPGFARTEFDRTQARAYFKSLLQRMVERADFDGALDHFADDIVSTRTALLEGQMEQILRLPSVTPNDSAGGRPNLLYRWRQDGEQFVVSCYGAEMRLPGHAAEPARYALDNARYRIADLPGDLDDAGKLVLVKRLVREGMVRVFY
jgi:ribosomal protein L16 Arg81 hydroxylase